MEVCTYCDRSTAQHAPDCVHAPDPYPEDHYMEHVRIPRNDVVEAARRIEERFKESMRILSRI